MIGEREGYLGSAFSRLVLESSGEFSIELLRERSGNIVLINRSVPVHLKYSTSRLSPWQFTYTSEHLSEVRSLIADFGVAFLACVCGRDGIACIDARLVLAPMSGEELTTAAMRISRRKGHQYRVSFMKNASMLVETSAFPKDIFFQANLNN